MFKFYFASDKSVNEKIKEKNDRLGVRELSLSNLITYPGCFSEKSDHEVPNTIYQKSHNSNLVGKVCGRQSTRYNNQSGPNPSQS